MAAICNFKVELSFRGEDGGFFSFLNAHIETIGEVRDQVKGNTVCKNRGEKAVDLHYIVSVSVVSISVILQVVYVHYR